MKHFPSETLHNLNIRQRDLVGFFTRITDNRTVWKDQEIQNQFQLRIKMSDFWGRIYIEKDVLQMDIDVDCDFEDFRCDETDEISLLRHEAKLHFIETLRGFFKNTHWRIFDSIDFPNGFAFHLFLDYQKLSGDAIKDEVVKLLH